MPYEARPSGMQSSYDIAYTRNREKQIKVPRISLLDAPR